METDVDSNASELRRSFRSTKTFRRTTYSHIEVKDADNTAWYDKQTEIPTSRIIDNIKNQGHEKRNQAYDNSFVETYTLSQIIKKFGERGYDEAFGEENHLQQRVCFKPTPVEESTPVDRNIAME